MRFLVWSPLVASAILFVACDHHCSDHGTWSAEYHSSESGTTSSGGATIGARGTFLTLPGQAFEFGRPAPFTKTLPSPDLAAVGRALVLAGSDRHVLDAVSTPSGVVALLRNGSGEVVLALFSEDGCRAAVAPEGARRLLFVASAPLRVEVVLSEGVASLATSS